MDGSVVRILPEGTLEQRETAAERLRRLKEELKAAAADELHELEDAMDHLVQVATDVMKAPDAFPPGVLEHCRNLVDEVSASRKSIALIARRAAR